MEDKLVIQKDNELIRKAINKFSYKQNQLMCALLGKYIHTKDHRCIDTVVSIDEFRQLFGIKSDGGNAYQRIKKAVDDFGANGSVGIYDEANKKYIWRPYFSEIALTKTEVKFSWNPKMYDDLINLKDKYTSYLSNDYLKLNSVYSQNLYEQMKSYERMPKNPQVIFSIDDLHRIMQTEGKKTYSTFNHFKTLCLNKAIKDINEKTDIKIDIEVVKDKKDKRKAIGIAFTIHSKSDYYNYNGCWLNQYEIDEIIYEHKAKNKILDLAKIKKENKDYYTLLRKNNKSDYQIIKNFIFQDKLKAGELQLSDEDKTMQTLAARGNISAIEYCNANNIPY